MFKKNSFYLIVFSFLYMAPVAVNVGSVGGNPINFAVSNFFLLLLPLCFLIKGRGAKIAILVLFFPLFFVVIGLLSSILRAGDVSTLLSMFSFVLPLFHIIVGAQFYSSLNKMGFSFVYFAYALSFFVFFVFLSDLTLGSFPRGCGYEGRWGGCVGLIEVYGFPNASMNFIAASSIFLGLLVIRFPNLKVHFFSVLILILIGALSFMSLSRSASLVYLISVFFISYALWGRRAIFFFVLFSVFFWVAIDRVINSFVFSGVLNRMLVAIESGDITTGRVDIWAQALEVISSSLLFGSAFFQFSQLSEFGTVHQQYLEVFYKVGLLGFLVYFSVLAFGYFAMIKCSRNRCFPAYSSRELILARGFVVCVLVACVFQPAISYQVLGNLMFFSCGYFFSKSNVVNEVNETNPPRYG